MSQYKTKQREALISYLMTVPGQHVTAAEVCDHFRSQGASIGTATVYRQLESLVDDGIVSKYIIDGASPACFEYMGEAHRADEVCFHCKCERCGRLIHMRCDELKGIGAHLAAHHGFTINPMRTVFYGVCDECRTKERGAGQ
jgi:Fur family ferric uptake transcriptional regulator